MSFKKYRGKLSDTDDRQFDDGFADDSNTPRENNFSESQRKVLKQMFKSLQGSQHSTIQDRFTFSNISTFKCKLCKHHGPCMTHCLADFWARFFKGVILNAAFKFLLSLMQDINSKVRMTLFRRLCHILFMRNFQLLWTGLFSGLTGVFIKAFICSVKHNFGSVANTKAMDFLAGFVSSMILMPLCFNKPYRKLLTIFALSLAGECVFKLIFGRKTRLTSKSSRFDRSYLQVRDKEGKILFKQIPSEFSKHLQSADDQSVDESEVEELKHRYFETISDQYSLVETPGRSGGKLEGFLSKNFYDNRLLAIEMAVCALMSAALHSLAYDYGDRYDDMDMSEHEMIIGRSLMKTGMAFDLDFMNYIFRKVFYHLMSSEGEDNFKYLLFKRP